MREKRRRWFLIKVTLINNVYVFDFILFGITTFDKRVNDLFVPHQYATGNTRRFC